MSINFQQVREKIKEIGANAGKNQKVLEDRRAEARVTLNIFADALDVLRQKVESAKAVDQAIRCALPLNENLDSSYPPPALPNRATLIAADGSQITPDRHEQVQFGLVNVGAIIMRLNSGETTAIHTDSQLLYDADLLRNGIPLSDGMVALERDLQERTQLEQLAKNAEPPVITFTDGPIELWGARDGEEAKAYYESLDKYLGVLSRLQSRGIITAGYVDKPASDLVVRLLEIAKATPPEMDAIREFHPFIGVTDRWLFGGGKQALLKPGHRSAVFKIQSKSEKSYKGVLALHFFYLNIGKDEHKPHIARVEIPQWVASDPEMLGTLHAVLVDQARIMGHKPYPYMLHRAHEIAVVSNEEKFMVQQMLTQELRAAGLEVEDGSMKQSAKDLPGRTAFK